MVVWHGCEYVRKAKERSYVVTSDLIYDGVVHEHPRFQIRVQHGVQDQPGSVGGRIVLKNVENGEAAQIFGVNHWNWDGTGLYIFPVYSENEYSRSVHSRFEKIIYPGANITIVADDTQDVDFPAEEPREVNIPTHFTANAVRCPLCMQDICLVTLYSHIPNCYTKFCSSTMGCLPLCTCPACKGVRTHKN